MLANDWIPYQDRYFITPPFAEYVSGHSAFSSASAEVFKRFFDSDDFGLNVVFRGGDSMFEGKLTHREQWYEAGVTDVPNTGPNTIGYSPAADIKKSYPTFTSAAGDAGISRLYGGIHIEAANVDGQWVGRQVGAKVWDRVEDLS
jgi:hypothetical protein